MWRSYQRINLDQPLQLLAYQQPVQVEFVTVREKYKLGMSPG
jgi:hypothetical protein